MATRVFGPKVSGLNVFGFHLGATTEVFLDRDGDVPSDLQTTLSGVLGDQQSMRVANDCSATVNALNPQSGVTITGTISDCAAIPASGTTPAMYQFKVTLRAAGTIKVKLIPIPVNVQIDAFDVMIAQDAKQHTDLTNAGSA